MNKTHPFLGEYTNDRKKAFPELKFLDIEISQDAYGHYDSPPVRRQVRFNATNFTAVVRCLNPRCQQGGLELENIIRYWESGEHDFPCNGHEGTPKGRHKGDPCGNSFKVKLLVEKD